MFAYHNYLLIVISNVLVVEQVVQVIHSLYKSGEKEISFSSNFKEVPNGITTLFKKK